jgi:phosphoserine phosphatase
MAARPLIVFDVNETLLDLETMEPILQRILRRAQCACGLPTSSCIQRP